MKTLKDYINEAKEEKKIYWHYDEKSSYEDLAKDNKFLEECADCFVILHVYESKHSVGRIKDYYASNAKVKIIFNKYFQPWTNKQDANKEIKENWQTKSWKTGYGAASCKHKILVSTVSEAFNLNSLDDICKKAKIGDSGKKLLNGDITIKTFRDENV